MSNITAEQRAPKQRTEPTMTIGFRGRDYKVPAIQNEINSNLAIHASQRPERMKTCKSDLQFLITDITNAADRYYRKSGNNPLTSRENTDRTVKYAITQLFNNKTFAAEFVRDPVGTSDKVITAVKGPETVEKGAEAVENGARKIREGGIKGIVAMVKKYRFHERGRFLSGVPIKRM